MVGGLILFHTGRIFDPLPFYVKDRPPNLAITLPVLFVALWGMPMFFLISGVGAWRSLGFRTGAAFLRERAVRLLVPLVVGIVLTVPPQLYVRALRDPAFDASYAEFLPRFFDVRLGLDFPWVVLPADDHAVFEPAHLWFLYYLFVFSALLLPAFLWIRGRGRNRPRRGRGGRVERVGGVRARRAGRPRRSGARDGGLRRLEPVCLRAAPPLWLLPRRRSAARGSEERNRRRALWIGIAATVALFGLGAWLVEGRGGDPGQDGDAASVAWRLLKALAGWAWIVVIVGFGARVRKRAAARTPAPDGPATVGAGEAAADWWRRLRPRLFRYANEVVLPFYVLHQTAIVVVGFVVLGWDLGAPISFVAIAAASFAVTALLAEGTRRSAPTRFLFGVHPRARPNVAPTGQPGISASSTGEPSGPS
jgi:hypothetical protein